MLPMASIFTRSCCFFRFKKLKKNEVGVYMYGGFLVCFFFVWSRDLKLRVFTHIRRKIAMSNKVFVYETVTRHHHDCSLIPNTDILLDIIAN